jgi:hypothetical protein
MRFGVYRVKIKFQSCAESACVHGMVRVTDPLGGRGGHETVSSGSVVEDLGTVDPWIVSIHVDLA